MNLNSRYLSVDLGDDGRFDFTFVVLDEDEEDEDDDDDDDDDEIDDGDDKTRRGRKTKRE